MIEEPTIHTLVSRFPTVIVLNLLDKTMKIEMPVKNQLQGMLAVFEPLDRAQSKKNFEPSFVKIG